jgi:hypothetical protein
MELAYSEWPIDSKCLVASFPAYWIRISSEILGKVTAARMFHQVSGNVVNESFNHDPVVPRFVVRLQFLKSDHTLWHYFYFFIFYYE